MLDKEVSLIIKEVYVLIAQNKLKEAFEKILDAKDVLPINVWQASILLSNNYYDYEDARIKGTALPNIKNDIIARLITLIEELEKAIEIDEKYKRYPNIQKIVRESLEELDSQHIMVILLLGSAGAGKSCFLLALHEFLDKKGILFVDPITNPQGYCKMKYNVQQWRNKLILPSLAGDTAGNLLFPDKQHEVTFVYQATDNSKKYKFKVIDFSGEQTEHYNPDRARAGDYSNLDQVFNIPHQNTIKPYIESKNPNILKFFVLDYKNIVRDSLLFSHFMNYIRAYTPTQLFDFSIITSKIDYQQNATPNEEQEYIEYISGCKNHAEGSGGKHFEFTILNNTSDLEFVEENQYVKTKITNGINLTKTSTIFDYIVKKHTEYKTSR